MSSFYDDASWLLIPSGIEEDVVFAQKPTSGLGDLTFTRASDATYTDAGGVVRRSPYNLLTFSEDFSNAAWTKTNATITANTTTAPNGTLTADTLTENNTNSVHRLQTDLFSFTSGTSYTISVFVKKNSSGRFLLLNANTAANARAALNLDTLAITNINGTATVQSVGDGWYRFAVTGTATSTQSVRVFIQMEDVAEDVAYLGNGSSFFIWGAQLVEGTSALDYFPTTNRQDVPRIDFRNADGTLSSCGRLLLEPQRTNVALQSESLNTNPNVADASTFTANVYTSPSGTQSADQLTETTANDKHGFYQYTTVTAQAYTASVFTKQTGRRYISFTSDVTGTQVSSFFDLQTKSVLTSASGHTCSVQDYGDGWLRLIVSFTASAGNRFLIWGGSINGTNNTYAGSTSVSQTFWGYQLEAGTYPTTYIPTTTAAVTRIADAASKTGVSSLIGQTEGTLFLDVNLDTRQAYTYFAIAPNLASATFYIGIKITNNAIDAEVVNSGIQAIITFNNSTTGRFKIAFAYKQNDFAFYINGALIGTDTSGTVPACSQIGLYNYLQVQMLKYNQAALFPTRYTNAQLAELTTL